MGLEQCSSTSPHRVELLGAPQGEEKRFSANAIADYEPLSICRRRIGLSTAIAKNGVRKLAAVVGTNTATHFPADWNNNAASGPPRMAPMPAAGLKEAVVGRGKARTESVGRRRRKQRKYFSPAKEHQANTRPESITMSSAQCPR